MCHKNLQTSKETKWSQQLNGGASHSSSLTNHLCYSHYTGQPVLAETSSSELKDFIGAKFYCPHALANSNQCTGIWEKTLEFSTVLSTLSPYHTCHSSSLNDVKTYDLLEQPLVTATCPSASAAMTLPKAESDLLIFFASSNTDPSAPVLQT